MFKALDVLLTLRRISGETSEFYSYQSAKIKPSSMKNGLKLYETVIIKFLGNSLIKRLEKTQFENDAAIQARLRPDTPIGAGEWLDLSGLIAPKTEVEQLLTDIDSGRINTLDGIARTFNNMHRNYYTYEWTWAIEKIQERFGKKIDEFTARDVIRIVEMWKDSVVSLDRMLYEDAKKEFALSSRTGFGVDGSEYDRNLDFEQVRGDFEKNAFVKEVLNHIQSKTELGDELIGRMKNIAN
jgi:hypothetical protein